MEHALLKLVCACEDNSKPRCRECVAAAFGDSIAFLDGVLAQLPTAESRRAFWRMMQEHAHRRLEILE